MNFYTSQQMKILNHIEFEQGEQKHKPLNPIVILHGLFGSSKNWKTIASGLNQSLGCPVYALDLRNHGNSFHDPQHDLELMAEDIRQWQELMKIERIVLLGHSMGGLAAARFVSIFPAKAAGLIMADIAPRKHDFPFADELKALQVNPAVYEKRDEIGERILSLGLSREKAAFLMMNLGRDSQNRFYWKLNVPVLRDYILKKRPEPFSPDRPSDYTGPVLAVVGGSSPFFTDDDSLLLRKIFTNAKIHTIAGAGHWLHITHQRLFLEKVLNFLKSHLSG